MIYIGLDVHKGYSRAGLFNPATGELKDLGNVRNQLEDMAKLLEQIPEEKCIVLEAGRNCHWMAATLEPLAQQVWIVNPAEARKLQARMAKTDKRDATALAFWAAKGALQPLWRPPAETLDLRELTRGKTGLTRLASKVRNMIRSLLARHGYECPYTDLLGKKAQSWLESVTLKGYAGKLLAILRELLPRLQEKAEQFEKAVEKEAPQHKEARRLMSIPGIGPFLGLAMAVEIGEAKRFATSTKLRGYSGLTASVSQSNKRDSRGPLTKRGNRWLRYAAVLAAQRMVNMRSADPRLKRAFYSVALKHGRNPAKVDCARRLLDLCHHLLVQEEDYQSPEARRIA